jgi:hypothetical protein
MTSAILIKSENLQTHTPMALSIHSDDFVFFETEDSSLERLPAFSNKNVFSILSEYEALFMEEEESADAVSCDPTPIGSNIQVVGQVPVTENTWHQDYSSILDLLRPLSHQQQTIEETPALSSSCFQSHQQQQEKEGYPPPQRSSIESAVSSDDTVVSSMRWSSTTPDRYTLLSQKGAGLNSTRPDQWNDRFQELAEFRQIHGHSLVPHSHSGNPSLLLWVKRQRYQYKLHKEGKHCTMTEEREAALEQLGFIWDSHAATWDERFRELGAFQSKYGHCKVPTSFPPNPQLAVWVKSQRRQFKLFLSGKKSYMSKERMIQLSSLGFVFNPRKLKGGKEPN